MNDGNKEHFRVFAGTAAFALAVSAGTFSGCAGTPASASASVFPAEAVAETEASADAVPAYDHPERDSPGRVVSERTLDQEHFLCDDAANFRALGEARHRDRARAYDEAFENAKARLLANLDSEISFDERERNGSAARERRTRARGRLKNISVAGAETRLNDLTGLYTVSVGIEFPKKNLEDDAAAVVVERVPEAGASDWLEIGAETFPAEISGLLRFFRDGEKGSFVVTPSRDAYLTVFWISEDGRADVTFPRGGGAAAFAAGGVPFALPEITFRVDDPASREEALRLIFVLTREPQKFRRPAGTDFFASLPRGSRFVRAQSVTIVR